MAGRAVIFTCFPRRGETGILSAKSDRLRRSDVECEFVQSAFEGGRFGLDAGWTWTI